MERAWRHEQTVASQARYLREAVRAGALSAERVGLGAYLGDPAAIEAVGVQAQVDPCQQPQALMGWAQELLRFGREGYVRVCLAEARRLLAELLRAQRERRIPERSMLERRLVHALEEELVACLLGREDLARLGEVAAWVQAQDVSAALIGSALEGHAHCLRRRACSATRSPCRCSAGGARPRVASRRCGPRSCLGVWETMTRWPGRRRARWTRS